MTGGSDGREFTFDLTVTNGPSINNPDEVIADFQEVYLSDLGDFKRRMVG